MDEQGGAVAGKVGLKTEVKTFSAEEDTLGNEISNASHPRRWTNAKVSLNIDEVTRQIQQNPNISGGLRSPQPWAQILDRSIKRCLLNEGTRHLLLGLTKEEWGWGALFWAYQVVVDSESDPVSMLVFHGQPHIPTVESAAISIVIASTFVNLIEYYISRKTQGNPYRLSLFIGPQFDRALILNATGRFSTLAKSLVETK
jgi:hypothetical protein